MKPILIAALLLATPAGAQTAQPSKAPSWLTFAMPKSVVEQAKPAPAPAERRVQTPEARQEEKVRADMRYQLGSRARENYGRESSVIKKDGR